MIGSRVDTVSVAIAISSNLHSKKVVSGRGRLWSQQAAFRSLTQANGEPIVFEERRGLEINAKSEISAWVQTQQHAVDGNLSEDKYERYLTQESERTSLSAVV
jgi:hypothetical protein